MTQWGENLEREDFGGFWQRVGAYAIDSLLLTVLLIVVAAIFIMPDISRKDIPPQEMIALGNTINMVGMAFSWLYFATMESSPLQATIGKRFFNLKVVDIEGQRISFTKALLRVATKIISALVIFLGFAMIAFTQRRQGLHDLIAGTYVVKSEFARVSYQRHPDTNSNRAEKTMREELAMAYKNVVKDANEKRAAEPEENSKGHAVNRAKRETRSPNRD